MKTIEARDQAALGLRRCASLAWSGMRHRMLRSGITTTILALAVAFLVYVLTHGVFAERVRSAAWVERGPDRAAAARLTRLTSVDATAAVIERVAAGDAEARSWSGLADEAWSDARRAAEAWTWTRDWFDALGATESAVLLGGRSLTDWLSSMEDGPTRRAFGDRIAQLGLGRSWAEHADPYGDRTLTGWPGLRDVAASVREGHRRSVARLAAADPRPVLARFAAPAATLGDELAAAGFAVTPAEREQTTAFAAHRQDLDRIRAALEEPAVRRAATRAVGSAEFDDVIEALARPDPAWWYAAAGDAAATHPPDGGVVPTARRYLREQRLAAATEGYEPVARATPFGLPSGTLWLAGLSLLVCVVGVTNALLMSVTERFHEIATMKCLGAMDRSVMLMFVAEAVMQGVLGGVAGVVIGLLIAAVRGAAEFGALATLGLSGWPELLRAAGLSLGLGVALAGFAAVLPSWAASRLAPMEAMRVE
ncbi:MAG: ABC transporter permease [Planctomycetota bacterium]